MNRRDARTDAPAWTTLSAAKNFVVHLRLPFQLVLAPFMLWGAAVAKTPLTLRFAVAFVVVHACLYGGTTAFNTHYDRDEGPVGGLAEPPPGGPWLLPGSIALQSVGLLAAAWVSLPFFAVCAAFAVLGALYSHPTPRWKGRPWLGWLTVMVGQGAIGALAGVVAQEHVPSPFRTLEIGSAVLAAALTVGAIYPLTQLFQIDEDRARGDVTIAMVLERRGSRFAAAVLAGGGALLMALSALAGDRAYDAVLLALTALPIAAGAAWVCAAAEPARLYRRVTVFQLAAASAFAAYAAFRLMR